MEDKIKVALVRGDSLNEWEGKIWGELGDDFQVTAFCSKKNLYSAKNLKYPIKNLFSSSDNFLVHNLDKYLNGRFQNMFGLEKELDGFDIAHTAEISYFFTTQAVRAKNKNKNLKVVATVWDNSFGRFEYNYWPGFKTPPLFWRKKINNIIKENVGGVDLFLPVTEFSRGMLLDYGVPENKIQILTPAVLNNDADAKDFLEEKGLAGKEIYMMVNRMVKEKGIYDVLYGWNMYLKSVGNKNKILLMIGNGPERENLMRLAGDLGVKDSILFIQQLPNEKVRGLYKYAKALILGSLPNPMWQEQFGYVLAEAITSGCPVVSTYSGAIPEVIGDAGILFAPGNPVELKNALEKIDNQEFYGRLKENCEKMKGKFVAEKFKNDLVNIYKKLKND